MGRRFRGTSKNPAAQVQFVNLPGLTKPAFQRRIKMAESVYKVVELIGTSTESWEKAAKAAVERAAETLRDLRIAEVVEQDVQLTDGKVELYRAKLKLSFKYEASNE
jgi:dodecin